MLEKRFAEVVKKNRLIAPGDKILIAASGGPDSTALALLIAKYRALFKIKTAELVYFDHGLRPRGEIARDVAVVEKLSALTGFSLSVIKLKIPSRGASVENKAREARYRSLEKIARAGRFDVVMTAHTADDNAETLVMRMIRGTGLKGLGGILPARPFAEGGITLARPLVFFRKKELLDFLGRRGARYSADSTNRDERFFRNAVRRRIMPELEKLNPAAVIHISNLSRSLSCDSDFMEAASARAYARAVSDGVLDLKKFFRYNVSVRNRLINMWLGDKRIHNFALTRAVESFLSDPSAKKIAAGGVVFKKQGNLVNFISKREGHETLLKPSGRH